LAYITGVNAQPLQVTAELVSAVPVPAEPTRYLGLARLVPQVELASDGLYANVSVSLALADPDATASLVWLLGVAYDSRGQIVAVRRWESPTPLSAGGSLDATLTLYTAGDPITRVEVLAEARP
jgi:hypothetical protein